MPSKTRLHELKKKRQSLSTFGHISEPKQQEKPLIHIIHKPTFAVVTLRDKNGIPFPSRNNHVLSPFKAHLEVQSNLSRARMQLAINWLYMFAEKKTIHSIKAWVNKNGDLQHNFTYRLGFITLTLPSQQNHDDEFIKEHMLQPFLYWLKRNYNAAYVWKAETQLNGNIHFHITVDTFIHHRPLASKWNGIMMKYGYCIAFNDGSNNMGNASTQIKSIKNEKGLAGIIGGYLTKNSIEEKYHNDLCQKRTTLHQLLQNSYGVSCNILTKKHYTRFVVGRLWACSESLSKIECITSELDSNFKNIERKFFTDNKLQSLGHLMSAEKKLKASQMSEQERQLLRLTDEDINRSTYRYNNVWIHRHLKFTKMPDLIRHRLAEEKIKRKFNTQTHFTISSLS